MSAGEQGDNKKPKLQPKIAALGMTHCLERSGIYDGSELVFLANNNQIATNISSKLVTAVRQMCQMLKAKINYSIIIKILSKIETDPSFAAFISAFEYYLTSPVPMSIKSDTKHLKVGENFFK